MTVLCHKRSTVHSIFQISISQNTICAEMIDFRKDGHIYRDSNHIVVLKYYRIADILYDSIAS